MVTFDYFCKGMVSLLGSQVAQVGEVDIEHIFRTCYQILRQKQQAKQSLLTVVDHETFKTEINLQSPYCIDKFNFIEQLETQIDSGN
jgi:hypothetical protein